MANFLIFEVRVPEHKVKDFEELMNNQKIGYISTGKKRITNLDDWLSGKQQHIS